MRMAFITRKPFLSDRSSIGAKRRPPGDGQEKAARRRPGSALVGAGWCALVGAGGKALAETREGTIDDRPQHLLIRVSLADDHETLADGHQTLGPGNRINRILNLAEADRGTQCTSEAVL